MKELLIALLLEASKRTLENKEDFYALWALQVSIGKYDQPFVCEMYKHYSNEIMDAMIKDYNK